MYLNNALLLEGGVAALAVSSGHAAQFVTFNTILQAGDNIVSSPYLYGGTYNQFKVTFKNLGLGSQVCRSLEVEDFEKLIDENTKAIYLETIGNPDSTFLILKNSEHWQKNMTFPWWWIIHLVPQDICSGPLIMVQTS